MGNSMEVPQKTRVAIWSSNPTPEHIFRQNYNSKRYLHFPSSQQHSSQQPRHGNMSNGQISISRWMDKDVVHIYNRILLSHKKNEIMLFAATWMQPEIIILSEVRMKEKDKYHISVTCGIWVKVTQSCPALCDLMHYTVYGILLPRIPEWVSYPFSSGGSSRPRNQTGVSCIAGGFFTTWATREDHDVLWIEVK